MFSLPLISQDFNRSVNITESHTASNVVRLFTVIIIADQVNFLGKDNSSKRVFGCQECLNLFHNVDPEYLKNSILKIMLYISKIINDGAQEITKVIQNT